MRSLYLNHTCCMRVCCMGRNNYPVELNKDSIKDNIADYRCQKCNANSPIFQYFASAIFSLQRQTLTAPSPLRVVLFWPLFVLCLGRVWWIGELLWAGPIENPYHYSFKQVTGWCRCYTIEIIILFRHDFVCIKLNPPTYGIYSCVTIHLTIMPYSADTHHN